LAFTISTCLQYILILNRPLDASNEKKVDEIFKQLTAPYEPEPKNVFILGRMLKVPLQARGVAKFQFNDLCKAALSAVDYIQVAREFHTIILTNIPKLDLDIVGRDVIRRFITLIDELYQHHVKLIITAAAPIEELLFTQGKEENKGHDDVSFAFDRTWSRLNEMQTKQYLESPHSVHNAEHHHLGTSKEVL
jgi:predicted ATPase